MYIDELNDFALSLANTICTQPFGPNVLVYKVNNKMFLLVPTETIPLQFNAKCNPEKEIELREQFPNTVLPGYHMNKVHWNTIIVDGKLSNNQLKEFVLESYYLICKK
jgi:predicted DNA-binding protein (MmcQ/YjbR family)